MRAGLAVVFVLALVQGLGSPSGAAAPAIYSARADDPWNRLFAALFTRTVQTRFTSEFADRGPFQPAPPDLLPAFIFHQPATVSTRVFNRYEEGDRAIDALYPAFLNQIGPRDALREPLHRELVAALDAAIADRTERPPLARLLMQTDLWSAFDPLAAFQDGRDAAAAAAAEQLTTRLAILIGRLALTRAEIGALGNNYEGARRTQSLADLFNGNGPWIEIVWGQDRMHDAEEQQRRSARVFVRPASRPPDVPAFLKAITIGAHPPALAAAALVMQAIAIDRSGRAVPTPLVTDVQIRTFAMDSSGRIASSMSEFELSRRRLLSDPSGGGFLRFDDRSEAYLATAGNDYGFATPALVAREPPTIGTLHTRCLLCHGADGAHMMSFAVQEPARMPQPRMLTQPNDERARYVAQKKEARDDFRRLIALAGLR